MWREPWFWREETAMARFVTGALSPLGLAYNAVGQAKLHMIKPQILSNCAVICIGNASLGGVGKTPFAIALAEQIQNALTVPTTLNFLTRGYGAQLEGPVQVDLDTHNAEDVGDEALLLAAHGPVWVSGDRSAGAKAAAHAGAQILLADDGYQNPSLPKDISVLLVADPFPAHQSIFPAGPFREPLATAVSRADAVVFIRAHASSPLSAQARDLAGDKIIGSAFLAVEKTLTPTRVMAFCGIGNPKRFRNSLMQAGFEVADFIAFPDHYRYGDHDLRTLRQKAAHHGAQLITTQKDACRLGADRMAHIEILPVNMVIDCPSLISLCVETVTRKMRGAS